MSRGSLCSISVYIAVRYTVRSYYSACLFAGKTLSAIFKKIFSLPTQTLHQSVIDEVYQVTSFYNQCVEVLPQLGSDLLVGLSCANSLLPAKLWYFLHCGCGTDVKTLTQAIICNDRLVSVLSIFCQVMQYLLK